MAKSKRNKEKAVVRLPPATPMTGVGEGDRLKGDRIVMYAREIHVNKKPNKHTNNHKGMKAKGKGDVICIIEKGIEGGRNKEKGI